MKSLSTILLLVCLIGSAVSGLLYCFLPYEQYSDLLVTPAERQDIGLIRQNATIPVAFTLTNLTSETVRIVDVQTSCGCTVAKVQSRTIPPGGTNALSITYSAGTARGPVKVACLVTYKVSDSSELRSITAGAYGTIDPEYRIDPEQLVFAKLGKQKLRAVVSPERCASVRVLEARCDKRFFTVEVKSEGMKGGSVVDVTFDPAGYYPDAGEASVVIQTDNKVQPTATIPIVMPVVSTQSASIK